MVTLRVQGWFGFLGRMGRGGSMLASVTATLATIAAWLQIVGELRVLDGLPGTLAQGVFSHPATYPVVLRISTNPGDILDDTVSSPRGLALKIIGVEGTRLPGSEDDATQDFVMVNGPAFVAPDAQGFARSLRLLAALKDAAVPWPEDESPYVAVARITVPRQRAWSEARAQQVDDGLSFSPWHGISALLWSKHTNEQNQ